MPQMRNFDFKNGSTGSSVVKAGKLKILVRNISTFKSSSFYNIKVFYVRLYQIKGMYKFVWKFFYYLLEDHVENFTRLFLRE